MTSDVNNCILPLCDNSVYSHKTDAYMLMYQRFCAATSRQHIVTLAPVSAETVEMDALHPLPLSMHNGPSSLGGWSPNLPACACNQCIPHHTHAHTRVWALKLNYPPTIGHQTQARALCHTNSVGCPTRSWDSKWSTSHCRDNCPQFRGLHHFLCSFLAAERTHL